MQSFSTFSECTTETAKLSISSQHTWHRSECLVPQCHSLLLLTHISWSGFIPHYTQGEQKKSQWNYSVMLGDNWWGRIALCCREELTDVEQVGLAWQAHLTPTEHVGTEVSGLPFHCSPFWREHSSQTKRKYITDRTDIGPNRNASPSSTAGFSYLFCLLSSCPLVGKKSHGQLCFWFFVTVYCFSLWNTVSTNCASAFSVGYWALCWVTALSAVNNPFIFSFRAVLHCNKAFFCSFHFLKFAESC